MDAGFLGGGFAFGVRLHAPDFDIQLAETVFDFRQAAIGVLAGGARFLQSLLNGGGAVAEEARQELTRSPE